MGVNWARFVGGGGVVVAVLCGWGRGAVVVWGKAVAGAG